MRDVVRPLVATFATSLGQKSRMHSVIVKVQLRDGSEGSGECPTSFAVPNENAQVIRGMIEGIKPGLAGRSIAEYADINGKAAQGIPTDADYRVRYRDSIMAGLAYVLGQG